MALPARRAGQVIRDAATSKRIPVLVDSRFRLSEFEGFTSATPNEDEVEQLLGKQLANVSDWNQRAKKLRERLGYRALLITRGGHGMMLFQDAVAPVHIAAVGAREPVDVTGAGDTVIATYSLALASDASFSDAARLANYAGGLVVMKRGTASRLLVREILNSRLLQLLIRSESMPSCRPEASTLESTHGLSGMKHGLSREPN